MSDINKERSFLFRLLIRNEDQSMCGIGSSQKPYRIVSYGNLKRKNKNKKNQRCKYKNLPHVRNAILECPVREDDFFTII